MNPQEHESAGGTSAAPRGRPPLDFHVHVAGTGAGGTGCWLRLRGWRRWMARVMLRQIGLPMGALDGDFDRLYVERLLTLVRGSSLGAAVILAHEQVYDDQGRRCEDRGLFYVPNDYVLKLGRSHPELLPGISLHPARPDALDQLDRCLAEGAVLLKLLPNCHNLDCADRRYTPFWEKLAEAGLPLLAHTGGEHTVPVVRAAFADPRILRRPLECGVTVIAAHCATKSSLFDPEYFDVFAEMTRQYPRLYGDLSALNTPIRGRHLSRCLSSPLVERMVHGSDFPVPVWGHFAWRRGLLNWPAFRRWQRDPNVLERDYQFKLAQGFPPDVFRRGWDLLRLPPARPPPP